MSRTVCPACRQRHVSNVLDEAADRLAEAVATIARVEHLFAARPDTPCRTTWPEGIECVEVPMADLRAALDCYMNLERRDELARAWDAGWESGCNDQQYGDENAQPWTPNPYNGKADA